MHPTSIQIERSRNCGPNLQRAPLDGSQGGRYFEPWRVLENHDIAFSIIKPDDSGDSVPVLAIFMRGITTKRWPDPWALMMYFPGQFTLGM